MTTINDEKGTLVQINKRVLVVTSEYQRKASPTLVRSIKRDWSWRAASVITVSRRDNVYYVVDGQHRVLAAKQLEAIDKLPCIVFDGLSLQEEAKMFHVTNTNRKALSAIDKFNASLYAGDVTSKYVLQRVEAHKFAIAKSGSNTLSCVKSAVALANSSKTSFERVLTTCTTLFKHGNINNAFFVGFEAIDKKIKIDDRFINRVKSVGIENLKTSIKKACMFYGNRSKTTIAKGIIEAVNKNLKNKFIID